MRAVKPRERSLVAGRRRAIRDARKPADAVEVELNRLRSLFREIVAHYVGRTEREIDRIHKEVGEGAMEDERALGVLLRSLNQLKLKPEKGRWRDIERVDDLIQEMLRLMEKA